MAEHITGEQHHAQLEKQKADQPRKPKNLPILVIGGVLLAALSFYGGMQYQKNHQPKATPLAAGQGTPGMGFPGRGGFGRRGFSGRRGTFGAVTAVSSSSITITDQTGASKTFTITASTTVTSSGQASTAGSIMVGNTVAIISSDGTTATRILLNPQGASASPPPPTTVQ